MPIVFPSLDSNRLSYRSLVWFDIGFDLIQKSIIAHFQPQMFEMRYLLDFFLLWIKFARDSREGGRGCGAVWVSEVGCGGPRPSSEPYQPPTEGVASCPLERQLKIWLEM